MNMSVPKILVKINNDTWNCPECEYYTDKLINLRRHANRKHTITITTLERKTLTDVENDEKRKKYKRDKKRAKARESKRELIDLESALVQGVYGCSDSILTYKKSTISNAGNGVFANIDILKGDVLTIYSGAVHSKEPTEIEYTIKMSDGSFLAGDTTPQLGNGLGSFINRSWTLKNCEFVEDDVHRVVMIVATKKIKKGNELFTTYGRGYRLKKQKPDQKLAFLKPKSK